MKRFNGKISSEYELLPQCVPGYYELEENLAKEIAKEYDAPSIIDIGVGTGITTRLILEKNPLATVVGVDSEKLMTDQAKKNLEEEIKSGRAFIVQQDILDYLQSLDSESVDVVASCYTLHNCARTYRKELKKEIYRVLKIGGMFINNDKYAVDNQEEYMAALVGQICRYKILADAGREDLQYDWTKHEIEDQDPTRIMRVEESTIQLKEAKFETPTIVERNEQYAILVAYKS